MFSWETSSPSPAPAIINGITRYQPESARGTIGIRITRPVVSNANPTRMMPLARRSPAFLSASSATPNIVSESGASDRPACIALYSNTICR